MLKLCQYGQPKCWMTWVSRGSSGGAEGSLQEVLLGLFLIEYSCALFLILCKYVSAGGKVFVFPWNSSNGFLYYRHVCLTHSFVFILCLFCFLPHPLCKLKQLSVRYLPPSCVGVSSFCYKFLFFSLCSSLASWAVQVLAATSAEIDWELVSTLSSLPSPFSPWAMQHQFSSCFPRMCSVGDTLSLLLSLIC